jgi:3-methyladenine DNA glycosylase AlkD
LLANFRIEEIIFLDYCFYLNLNKVANTMKIQIFLEKLKALEDPLKAVQQQKYHKSSRVHWGVIMPLCEKLAVESSKNLEEKEVLRLALELWQSDIFDAMMCAGKLLCQKRIKPSQDVWELVEQFLQKVDGWALEDILIPVAGRSVLAEKKLLDRLESWTGHSNFWMRRAALVYTLPFAKKGQDPERMLSWAASYREDKEWFIQKAIGWWLRTLGEHNPERVHLFLKSHPLKGVALREATRKLQNFP